MSFGFNISRSLIVTKEREISQLRSQVSKFESDQSRSRQELSELRTLLTDKVIIVYFFFSLEWILTFIQDNILRETIEKNEKKVETAMNQEFSTKHLVSSSIP